MATPNDLLSMDTDISIHRIIRETTDLEELGSEGGSTMRTLCFDRFGDPQVLQVAEIADPVASGDQAVIAVQAASAKPSDVKNVAGAFPATVLPRVPGRDRAR